MYTRLQAAFYARQFTKDMIKETQKRSIELYNYAEYLYELNNELIEKENSNKAKIYAESKQNESTENQLLAVARKAIHKQGKDENKRQKDKYDDKDKERDALAIKFFFDHEKKDEQSIHPMYQSVQR